MFLGLQPWMCSWYQGLAKIAAIFSWVETVSKCTLRRSGNERFWPVRLRAELAFALRRNGINRRIVPVMRGEFADKMRSLHKTAGVSQIHNGLSRSAISHYLAAYPKTEVGETWFKICVSLQYGEVTDAQKRNGRRDVN
jgi:hypothetical protein